MASDFIGVPYPVWSDLEARTRFAAWLATTAIVLLALLIAVLIRKGVLAGWSDLTDFTRQP